jgi:hypothetical protein
MRRLLPILFLTVTAMALAACSGGDDESGTAAGEAVEERAAVDFAPSQDGESGGDRPSHHQDGLRPALRAAR